MVDKRKFSLFISSTYEDLKEERQALIGVALENGYIPVGMEQFHGAPADQWTVITKVIDECDFYLLVVGGRYGSIDESVDKSYTEKEYDYAKSKRLPVLVLIKNTSSITEDKMDSGYSKYDKYELLRRLNDFRDKVKNDKNSVAFFDDLNGLKYEAGQSLKNATEYADEKAGWVRYKDVADVINEEVEGRNKAVIEYNEQQQNMLREMKDILDGFGNRISDLENNQLAWEEVPAATNEDIGNLFRVEGETLIIGNNNLKTHEVGKDDVRSIPVDSAFLLVYAADGDGQIMKVQTLGSPVKVLVSGKTFMVDNSQRESARWVEALDRLISWGWVKPVGYKGQIFELTGTGYTKADWLKEGMKIDTSKEPLEELQQFGG